MSDPRLVQLLERLEQSGAIQPGIAGTRWEGVAEWLATEGVSITDKETPAIAKVVLSFWRLHGPALTYCTCNPTSSYCDIGVSRGTCLHCQIRAWLKQAGLEMPC